MATVSTSISTTSLAGLPKAAPAAILLGPYGQPYTIGSIPVPRPGFAEALVRLSYSGVCHGDVYSRNGGGPAPTLPTRPLIGGHEGVGTIVALGDGCAQQQQKKLFRIGDTVGIAWRSSVCGTCEPCVLGAENHCTRQCVTGMHRDGTYQGYITFPVAQLVCIPPGMNLASVCPILCAGVTAYTSLRMMNPRPGKWCVIVGAAGGLGHLAIQYARAMSLKVLAIDGGLSQKEAFCMRMGADVFVDFTKGRFIETVREKTQGGADYVLVLSPHQSCYDDASEYIRFGGQLMAVGIGNAHMPLRPILKKNLTIRSNETGTTADIEEALSLSAAGKIVCEVDVMKLRDLDVALDRLQSGKVLGKLVVDLHSEIESSRSVL